MSVSCVLVTGLSGVLGREVVARLLRDRPDLEVVALVRDTPAARRRIADALLYMGWANRPLGFDRLTLVHGDLARSDLGLASHERRRLQRRVTHVVHMAASTSLDHRCVENTRRVNLHGTRAILGFASGCGRLESLVYAGTAFAIPCAGGFRNEYERCKFQAETEVRAWGRAPTTILRPSIIVGDQHDGRFARCDGIYRPLRALCRGGHLTVPGHANARVDIVPLDVVANAAVASLTAREDLRVLDLISGANAPTARTLVEAACLYAAPEATPLAFDAQASTADDLSPFFHYIQRPHEGLQQIAPHGSFDPMRALVPGLRFARDTHWWRDKPWAGTWAPRAQTMGRAS